MDSKTLDFAGRVIARAQLHLRNDGTVGGDMASAAMDRALVEVCAEEDAVAADAPAEKPKRK